ncbi:hypothetical protein ACQRBN_08675 [Bariatricus sp. SGI.154]|uniref:hypothetical protein n=1 Tax=Bariatricus sp. SGI.154 TaxID=3420549 RepID=UPI003D05F42F
MRFGGMPGIADVGLDQEKAWVLLEGIYSTVIIRDILERENRRGQKRITDSVLLKKIVMFLADNIGSSISVSSIGNTLLNEGLLEDGNRKGTPRAHTVQAYVNALLEAYEKIVLSMNTGMDSSYDGIKSINLIDWLISE